MYTRRTLLGLLSYSLLFGTVASVLTLLYVGQGSIVESNPFTKSLLISIGNLTLVFRLAETALGFSLLFIARRFIQKRDLTGRPWLPILAIDFPALFLTILIFFDMINDVSVAFYGVNLTSLGFIQMISAILAFDLVFGPRVFRLRKV